MTDTRVGRWRRRLGYAALAAVALVLIGWRAAIYALERLPDAPAVASMPACPGTLDPRYRDAAARARRHLAALRAEREIPGLAVALGVAGRLVWSEGVGYADRDRGLGACPDQQFRLQSVSKPVTAAGMARLAERGLLDLDAPVRRYVPGLPPALGAVTARQLASHRAGVRHYRDDAEALTTTRYDTAVASLEKFRDDPLLFAPGSASAYSTYGFVLLSAAMEGASGLDFPGLMRREVFEPLGMRRTEAERGGRQPGAGRVRFYDNVTPYSMDGRVHPSPPLDFSGKWGGGGLLSTVEDLVRFANAHMPPFNRGFLRDDTLAEQFTARTGTRFFGRSLGWELARDHRARRVCLHFGAGSGGTSFLAIFPDQRVSVAVLANLGHARFPMPRLIGIAQPFVPDPWEIAAWVLAAAALGLLVRPLLRPTPARRPGPPAP